MLYYCVASLSVAPNCTGSCRSRSFVFTCSQSSQVYGNLPCSACVVPLKHDELFRATLPLTAVSRSSILSALFCGTLGTAPLQSHVPKSIGRSRNLSLCILISPTAGTKESVRHRNKIVTFWISFVSSGRGIINYHLLWCKSLLVLLSGERQ